MAFLRYAKARVLHPSVDTRGWKKVRTAATGAPAKNLVAQATEILGEAFSPENYLLTHCTIVASVDVDEVPNAKIGKFKIGSKTHTRKWGDFHITPETTQYVNNNGDSWARSTLAKSYRTFVGGHNFLEHVQIEEHSKGRIIDAVARDIGDSLYIDILVATHRKHTDLVRKIEAGEMGTLSMGCSVDFTICTKCGNVAVDEVDLCDHIRYEKMNRFIDATGKQRIIAELCGHPSIDPTGGVTFIEASWVETPAFTGAVLRNVIEPQAVSARLAAQAERVLNEPPPEWLSTSPRKAASTNLHGTPTQGVTHLAFNFGEEPSDEEGAAPAAPAEPKGPLDDLQDDIVEEVVDSAREELQDAIRKRKDPSPEESTMNLNDTIVKEARESALNVLVRTASSDVELVNGIAELDNAFGSSLSVELYRVALRVGPSTRFSTLNAYLEACQQSLGRKPTPSEAKGILRVGRCLAMVHSRTQHHEAAGA